MSEEYKLKICLICEKPISETSYTDMYHCNCTTMIPIYKEVDHA